MTMVLQEEEKEVSSPLRYADRNQRQRRLSFPSIICNNMTMMTAIAIIILLLARRSTSNLHHLINKNLGLQQRGDVLSNSRHNNTTTTTTALLRKRRQHFNATIICPSLPDRLMNSYDNYGKHIIPQRSLDALLLSNDEVDRQRLIMKKMKHGTMGDIILKCPSSTLISLPSSCRGILKVYKSNTVYQHVKYCLTLLKDTGIVPRILYSNDTTQTIVEEEKGQYTMRSYYSKSNLKKNHKHKKSTTSPTIPIDFDQQLRRILCLLQQYSVIHRDITDANFIIDDDTGMMSIIDFGDAYVVYESANYNWRNIQNLFMIWWNNYLENQRMEEFITIIKSQLMKGIRKQWRPPSSSRQRQYSV
jgi:serine/threonine protein kinase